MNGCTDRRERSSRSARVVHPEGDPNVSRHPSADLDLVDECKRSASS